MTGGGFVPQFLRQENPFAGLAPTRAVQLPGPIPLSSKVTCNGGDCDVGGITIRKRIPGSTKWYWNGSRYVYDRAYRSPWYDIGLDGFLEFELGGYAVAASPVAFDFFFAGQRVGIFNNNPYLRVGLGPGKGASETNYWESFRVVRGTGKNAPHFDIWPR